eukprot:CAMPEP_0180564100 /NCGR_PEP_ID=MMETSP1037_2-20121125/4832_1 /TAXON_ID=632150 /ORGANISM="Azadinium spinosum, Strain 3D9" /LENGTH=57 /DNA_ID=CAMNT_0022580981 /DNA_START=279 /DNA_END=452 /DNA_ORIENTATION=+
MTAAQPNFFTALGSSDFDKKQRANNVKRTATPQANWEHCITVPSNFSRTLLASNILG